MKKVAAILLLAVVLFNLCGYYLLVNYFQQRQESSFEVQIDNNSFSRQELMYIKFPVNLPYYNNTEAFERISGTIEINGVQYKYVARRVFNDSVELACLPNHEQQKFKAAKNDFASLASEALSSHSGKKQGNTLKNISLEFCDRLEQYALAALVIKKTDHNVQLEATLPARLHLVQQQPPDALA